MSVCLSVYPYDILKTDAARITKLDKKSSKTSPGNPFILDQKVKGKGHESQKTFPGWVLGLL